MIGLEHALALSLALPWALLLLLLWPRSRALGLGLAPWAALPALLVALWALAALAGLVAPHAADPGRAGSVANWALPQALLGLHFGLDATTAWFLLLAGLVWTLAGLAAHAYHHADPHRLRLWLCWLSTLSGNLWLIAAQDAIGFYAGFALMTFAGYGLVVHSASPAAWRAGRVYLSMAVLGEAALLSGLLLHVAATGSLALPWSGSSGAAAGTLATLLLWLGFGVKAGVLGLHLWLPLAHPVAPTPASAVLSGVMIKAGLLGWMQFLPLGGQAMPLLGTLAMVAGLLAALAAVAVGLTQRQPKVVLAYSSISQMGLLTLGVGAALLHPPAWALLAAVLALHALHHALAKAALFLGVAALAQFAHGSTARRWALAAQALPALALAGLPWCSGFWAKDALKGALAGLPAPWPWLLAWFLPAAALGTSLLLAHLLSLQAHAPAAGAAPHAAPGATGAEGAAGTAGSDRALVAAWLATVAASLALGLVGLAWALAGPEAASMLSASAAEPAGAQLGQMLPAAPTLAASSAALGLAPVLLALALLAAWRVWQRWRHQRSAHSQHPSAHPHPSAHLPPGDLLQWLEPPLRRGWQALLAYSACLNRVHSPTSTAPHRWPRALWLEERQLRRLSVAGIGLAALLALLLLSLRP